MASAVIFTLHRADGSVSYSSNGTSVIAAVNGPIEVQRRDELPEEATIDVTVRPASGVGGECLVNIIGTRTHRLLGLSERHLEAIIHDALRHIILVSAHPRTLIQFTLQITESQDNEIATSDQSLSEFV